MAYISDGVAALPAEAFVERLRTALSPVSLHVGTGFRFGRDRLGDVALLRSLGARDGFTVEEVAPVEALGGRVSSSRIREAVVAGDVDTARALLGRAYALEGRVERGAGMDARQTLRRTQPTQRVAEPGTRAHL